MSKYLTEMIGTFFLVLTISLTASQSSALLGAVAIGSILMTMVYMGGHVSGAHYNPAVSLAVMLRGKLSLIDLGIYVVSQLVGAVLAAWVGHLCLSQAPAPEPKSISVGLAVLLEVLYTFALALVVLNVATSAKTTGNSYYGLAIGFTVLAGAVAVGPVTGGAFNPAVGTGLTLIRASLASGSLQHLWIYWVGPLLGGAAAAGVFRLQEAAK